MPRRFFFLCFFLLLSFQAFPIQVVRGPYLQVVTPHSITIRWRTDSLCNSVVYYGLSSTSLNNTYTNISLKTDHSITLHNLQPNTLYYYAIANSNTLFASGNNYYFRTAPTSSPNYSQPLHFWAVGDISKQTPMEAQVRDAYLQHKGNDYVNGWIMLGDNAYENGVDTEFQHGFFNYFQDSVLTNTPLIPVVGNHEYANNPLRREDHQISYFDIFAFPINGESGGIPSGKKEYYSMDYGNVHFVQLDSYGWELVNGNYFGLEDTTLSPQVNWLKSDLAHNTLPWTIVSFHHPPYCMGTHESDSEADLAQIRTNLTPILERYNVDLVLNGHSHSYERSQFIKGHTGTENTFDGATHIRQFSSGRYDTTSASCPYIKHSQGIQYSDSGTVYTVVGSGSAYSQAPFASWPHNAMYYSNYLNNGSLYLSIEDNRLDAEWVSMDTLTPVKDRFTIFKDVNHYTELHVNPGTLCTLRASWPANEYLWNTNDTSRQISITATQDSLFIVTDAYHCLSDTFQIKLPLGLPVLESNPLILYPNPALSVLYVSPALQHVSNYEVYDLTGRLVLAGNVNGDLKQIFLPDHLQNGLYTLHIHVDNYDRYQGKFLVQR